MALREGLVVALAAVLAVAVAAKLRRPREAAEGLSAFGVGPALRPVALGALVLAELGLAAGLVLGARAGSYAAAAAFAGFAAAVALALRAGRAGAPCACFGARSTLSSDAVRRNVALAVLAGAAPSVPSASAIAVAAGALTALALPLLATRLPKARQRERGALEIESEGPALGTRTPLLPPGATPLTLAVFLAEDCAPCREVAGAVAAVGEHPAVTVRTFDERRDRAAWQGMDVPGAPYAVALDASGRVRAKGTFNTSGQLESVLATAEWRSTAPGSSRRRFLVRAAAVLAGAAAADAVTALAARAAGGYYTFCGHTYTTGGCPHPTGLPRVDSHQKPLRAKDGRPVDDLGRLVDGNGLPVDEHGHRLRDPDGEPLPAAPRSKLCSELVRDRFHFRTYIDGSWHRCCNGHVRKLMDCCSYHRTRINGDAALTGYCYQGRKVFCVFYYQTRVPC